MRFYDERPTPPLILVSDNLTNPALVAEAFTLRAGRKIEILLPQRGEKREIVDMAVSNAREQLARRLAESSAQRELLDGVCEAFALPKNARQTARIKRFKQRVC